MLPSSPSEAIASGSEYYFTGKPCKHGHVARRKTKTRACVECQTILWRESAVRKRRNDAYRAKEREKNRLAAAALRATDPEYVRAKNEANREYAKRKRATDPEFRQEANRKAAERWKEDANFREERALYLRRWLAENREKVRASANRRRALELGAAGSFTAEDIETINAKQGFLCSYCQASTAETYHVDHKTPLSRGGSNWPDNVQVLCPSCNCSKKDKTDLEFRAALAANDNHPRMASRLGTSARRP